MINSVGYFHPKKPVFMTNFHPSAKQSDTSFTVFKGTYPWWGLTAFKFDNGFNEFDDGCSTKNHTIEDGQIADQIIKRLKRNFFLIWEQFPQLRWLKSIEVEKTANLVEHQHFMMSLGVDETKECESDSSQNNSVSVAAIHRL